MATAKQMQSLFPDLSQSVIETVQKSSKTAEDWLATLQQITSCEPSDSQKELMLLELKDYQQLGREKILGVLKECKWDVEKALIPLFDLMAANDRAAHQTKANELLENLFTGISKDQIQQVLERNDGDVDATAEELMRLATSIHPEDRKSREQRDLVAALKLRFPTATEDQVVEALKLSHWFPQDAVQLLLRQKRDEKVQQFKKEFPTLTEQEIRHNLESNDTLTRGVLQVICDAKVELVEIPQQPEKDIFKEAQQIAEQVEDHVAAQDANALARQAIVETLRLEGGAGYASQILPATSERPHNPIPAEGGMGVAVNSIPLRVPKVVPKSGQIKVCFDQKENPINDWIGMYTENQPDTSYYTWQWVGTTGEVVFTAPSQCTKVFFRYFLNRSYRACGVSSLVHVGPEFLLTPTIVSPTELTVKVDKLTEGAFPNCWIGFYPHREKNPKSYLTYKYLCDAKELSFAIPKAGSWTLRCFPEKSHDFAAEVVVTVPGTDSLTLSFSPTNDLLIKYSLTTVDPDTDRVWIGIYRTNDDSKNYKRYKFVTDRNGVLEMKGLSQEGAYEARLFACGTYDNLCSSPSVNFVLPK